MDLVAISYFHQPSPENQNWCDFLVDFNQSGTISIFNRKLKRTLFFFFLGLIQQDLALNFVRGCLLIVAIILTAIIIIIVIYVVAIVVTTTTTTIILYGESMHKWKTILYKRNILYELTKVSPYYRQIHLPQKHLPPTNTVNSNLKHRKR